MCSRESSIIHRFNQARVDEGYEMADIAAVIKYNTFPTYNSYLWLHRLLAS